MEPCSVVEALDEGEDIAPGLGASLVVAVMNELSLQGMEEALHRGIVVAIGPAAHRCGDAGTRKSVAIGMRSILNATIGVVDQSGLRPLLLNGHDQCVGCEFDLHMLPHGPADDLSAEEIHDSRQIQPA